MSDFQLLRAEVLIGDEARQFVEGHLGQLMIGRAKQIEDEAIAKMASLSPWNPTLRRQIRELQNDIRFARLFVSYLNEMLANADIAASQLELAEARDV